MGLVAVALAALVGHQLRTLTTTVKENTSATVALSAKFDRMDHAVFGVLGDNGLHGDMKHIRAFRHKMAGCLQAVGLYLGLEFDEDGAATETASPPLIERRLGLDRRQDDVPVVQNQRRTQRRGRL